MTIEARLDRIEKKLGLRTPNAECRECHSKFWKLRKFKLCESCSRKANRCVKCGEIDEHPHCGSDMRDSKGVCGNCRKK